jgi:Ala-tRNA(Pro) deacylase
MAHGRADCNENIHQYQNYFDACHAVLKQIQKLPEQLEFLMTISPVQLLEMLDEKGFDTNTIEHQAVFSVEESRDLTLKLDGGHTKNLFVKDKKDNYFLLVIEQSAQINLNQVHRLIGAKSRLSFGKPDKLMEYLGVTPGSVTAFSVVNDHDQNVKLIIDKPLLAHEKINCHPLINTMTTTISREDLLNFMEQSDHKPDIIQMSQLID